MEQREQREHVEFLYESMRATQGAPEFGLAVGQLLVAARRLLRAEYAEILLLPDSADERPRSVSGAAGELLMHPEERLADGEEALRSRERRRAARALLLAQRRAAARPRRASSRSRELEDAIVGAAARRGSASFGLLVVGDRVGDVSTFYEDDLDAVRDVRRPCEHPARERPARALARRR